MAGLDFVALDVETANRRRGSICAIGLTVVRNSCITETHSWLCRPPESISHFDPFNVAIHGIDAERVADEPSCSERIGQALDIVGNLPIVAHNAAFDVGALREACDADGLLWPTLNYGCTLVWARRVLDLISYRLPIVADELGIPFGRHHDASEDSRVCAEILLALAGRLGSRAVDEVIETTRTRLGSITPEAWRGCQVVRIGGGGGGGGKRLVAVPANADADPEHPLYGQVVVFTGALAIRRQDAWDAVAMVGGSPEKNITKRTTHLVVGDGFTGDDPAEFHTGKAAKANKIRKAGGSIEVLTENDFECLVADVQTFGIAKHVDRRRSVKPSSRELAYAIEIRL